MLSSVGIGLISTWTVDTGMAYWIGYQVVFGFGVGLGLQQANLTTQVSVGALYKPYAIELGHDLFANVLASPSYRRSWKGRTFRLESL